MAKLIITNGHDDLTNVLIELNDGSQIEVDADWEQLITAVKDDGQTVIEVKQIQPDKSDMPFHKLLDELYGLTQIEECQRVLTKDEVARYNLLVEILQENNIEIPFGINQ